MNSVTVDGETYYYNSLSELDAWILEAMYADDIPEVRESKSGSKHDMKVHGKNMKQIENSREYNEV